MPFSPPVPIILHKVCSAESKLRGVYQYAETALPLAKGAGPRLLQTAVKLLQSKILTCSILAPTLLPRIRPPFPLSHIEPWSLLRKPAKRLLERLSIATLTPLIGGS
jgi:hypothetical protein